MPKVPKYFYQDRDPERLNSILFETLPKPQYSEFVSIRHLISQKVTLQFKIKMPEILTEIFLSDF